MLSVGLNLLRLSKLWDGLMTVEWVSDFLDTSAVFMRDFSAFFGSFIYYITLSTCFSSTFSEELTPVSVFLYFWMSSSMRVPMIDDSSSVTISCAISTSANGLREPRDLWLMLMMLGLTEFAPS